MSTLPSFEDVVAESVQLRLLVAELQRANKVLADRVVELEARLGRSRRNSSKPPSSEGYEKPAPKSRRQKTDRASGGQPGPKGHTLERVAAPDEVLVHEPVVCGGCGESLARTPVVSTESRQVLGSGEDLPGNSLRTFRR